MLPAHSTKRVLQIGVGGVGAPLAVHLGLISDELILMDGDEYEEKNVVRQPFAKDRIGENKAVVLAESLRGVTKADVSPLPEFLNEENKLDILEGLEPTLIVSCVDNDEARKLIWEASKRTPILWGANELWDPQAGLSTPDWSWNPMEFFPPQEEQEETPECGVQTINANMAAANLACALLQTHLAPQEKAIAEKLEIPVFMARTPGGVFVLKANELGL